MGEIINRDKSLIDIEEPYHNKYVYTLQTYISSTTMITT